MKLHSHRYGKAKVRVLKVFRADSSSCSLKELEVFILLEGAFEGSYTKGDNSGIVATDTMKNTINVLAHKQLGQSIEPFALSVAEHFLNKYSHVNSVTVEIAERVWEHLDLGGRPVPSSFTSAGKATPFTRVIGTANGMEVTSGIRDLIILKTSGSAFEGYMKDEFTTLPETNDRLLATSMIGTWVYRFTPPDYNVVNSQIVEKMLEVFATHFSPSVQATLYEMGMEALASFSEISRVSLTMPNLHCLPIDLKPFGLENKNEIFVPTEAPQGWIEATIVRDA
jgi:urate oxidase